MKTAASNPDHQTQKNTLSEIKETECTPKFVISKLHNEVGGVLGAESNSEMPRNHHQVYNMQHSSGACPTTGKADSIFELIQQYKINLMPGGENSSDPSILTVVQVVLLPLIVNYRML